MFATIGRRGCVSMNYEQNPMVDVKNRVELRLVLGLFFVNAPLRGIEGLTPPPYGQLFVIFSGCVCLTDFDMKKAIFI